MKLQPPSDLCTTSPSATDTSHPPNPAKRRAPRTNYYEPARWQLVDQATRLHNFSSQAIVRELTLGPNSSLFTSIDRGTVNAWINKDHTGWKPAVLERVARAAEGNTPQAPVKPLGRPQLLPLVLVTSIITLLTVMRAAGTLITHAVARSVVMAFIRTDAPDLFNNPKFKCSDAFVRNVLRDKLDWSWRATTQAAQKLPDNWLQQCTDFACWLTWNITLNSVPPELVINADQTDIQGLAKQIAAIGKGKKQQFTLMVAVASSGDILPFQAIFKGKTKNSLPSERTREDGKLVGFQFTPGGEKHWSTLATMKEWVDECVVPYANRKRQELGRLPTQKAILILDCWSVHKGEEFLTWMKASHPLIILVFVPAGCTSVAQPCDTRINRILKHLINLAISSQIPTDPLFVEVDSPEFDDDSALNPNMLVDIWGQLPMDLEEQEGGYIYTGDVA
ncbi:DDE superfamily endonuclease [Ceratobasidium sp. AG-Ba]|nr:DDE superfamily endonuclease [Ceratobasidium sp. AG-Ba]